MKKVKVGLIGAGEVAQVTHLPILEQLSDRFEVVALCDISPSLVKDVGERFRIPERYVDAKEMIAKADIDIVFILNSDEYHAECAIEAAKHGKHVFVEKPVCLTLREADEMIQARDEAGVMMMVGYMRRYAPAFVKAKEELASMGAIKYARIRDIIGQTTLITRQAHVVKRYDDIPEEAKQDRSERAKRMVQEALGDVPQELVNTYRQLGGLGSHDLSAMRELIGMPKRVVAAKQWNNGKYINALLEFDGFYATYETGVDKQVRFDAHLEVFGESKQIRVQYDSPYIRHLPTTLIVNETKGESFTESVERPTFTDPYTVELIELYDCLTKGIQPKTTIEDYKEDLVLFRMIIDAIKADQ
jgi:predicted dehydrogenase